AGIDRHPVVAAVASAKRPAPCAGIVRVARRYQSDHADQKKRGSQRHLRDEKAGFINAARSRVAPTPRSVSSYNVKDTRYFGRREGSPLANASSAMREPLMPTQEFLVSGYLSV